MIYLYDPISNIKTASNYKLIAGMTGKTINNLAGLKCKRLKVNNINCYIVDEFVTNKELNKLMNKEVIEGEVWKKVKDSLNYYVSNYGRIKRKYKTTERILMPYLKKVPNSKNSRQFIKIIYIDNKVKAELVHKLVANAFLYNVDNLKCVVHKNGNVKDNRADNLEYVSRKTLGKKYGRTSRGKYVYKLDADTEEVLDEYCSMAEAGRKNYLHRETVRRAVNGMLKTAGGWKWITEERVVECV